MSSLVQICGKQIQCPAVEPAASARATLEKYVRKRLHQSLGEVVKPQRIAMPEFPLPVRGQARRDVTVLAQLDIGDVVFAQYFRYRFENIAHYFLSCKIEHLLVATAAEFNARLSDRPFGMRAVQDIRVAENVTHAQFILVFQVRTRTLAEYVDSDEVFAALQQIDYIELGGRMRNGGIPLSSNMHPQTE